MKTLLSTMILLFVGFGAANADPGEYVRSNPNVLTDLRIHATSDIKKNEVEAPLVRQLKIKTEIFKKTITTLPNGEVIETSESVCRKNYEAPLFDFHQKDSFAFIDGWQFECISKYLNQDVKVRGYSIGGLQPITLFTDESDREVKWFSSGIMVVGDSNEGPIVGPQSPHQFSVSSDLNATSIVQMFRPTMEYKCNDDKCYPNVPEYFWATTEIKDEVK